MIGNINEITFNLCPTEYAARCDRVAFLKWEKGIYTTEEMISSFKYNNHIEEDIDPEVFRRWLASIGWRRKDGKI